MRRSKANTAESRREILAAASRLFRQHGPDRVSVADVMNAAGMTHGGFYKHFASKEALLAAAIDASFAEKLDYLKNLSISDPPAAIRIYATGYLTMGHVEDLGSGCPIAGLTGDAVRASPEISNALAAGAETTIARFAEAMGSTASADDESIRRLSAMIGAVVLARAVNKPALKQRILRVARALIS